MFNTYKQGGSVAYYEMSRLMGRPYSLDWTTGLAFQPKFNHKN